MKKIKIAFNKIKTDIEALTDNIIFFIHKNLL